MKIKIISKIFFLFWVESKNILRENFEKMCYGWRGVKREKWERGKKKEKWDPQGHFVKNFKKRVFCSIFWKKKKKRESILLTAEETKGRTKPFKEKNKASWPQNCCYFHLFFYFLCKLLNCRLILYIQSQPKCLSIIILKIRNSKHIIIFWKKFKNIRLAR